MPNLKLLGIVLYGKMPPDDSEDGMHSPSPSILCPPPENTHKKKQSEQAEADREDRDDDLTSPSRKK